MFGKAIRLPFTLLGIPVFLDWSFLVILPLMGWMIGSQVVGFAHQFDVPRAEQLTQAPWPFLLGLIAAIGLFVCVLLHELGHSIAARLYGVPVQRITLWFLGGVAEFAELPRRGAAEAVIAIVGPLVSIALAALCWVLLQVVSPGALATLFVLSYLARVNVAIAIFNMIPALPLDGGRVLRSLLALRIPYARATRVAGRIGKVLAVILGLVGLLSFNMFLVFIAFFIFMAVNAETQMAYAEELLGGVSAAEAMNPNVSAVTTDSTAGELVQRMMLERHLGYPVVDADGRPVGIVTVREATNQPPETTVGQIMVREAPIVRADQPARDALQAMARAGYSPVMVVDDAGRLTGLISKADILRLLQLREMDAQRTAPAQAAAAGPAGRGHPGSPPRWVPAPHG